MQEKVQAASAEANIYEGTIPPNSWFKDNIIHYYEVKSDTEFFTKLIVYLQQKDLENLQKYKLQGKQVLEFAYAPEDEGTAEEVSRNTTFNLLQNQVGTQIQYMTKLINILKSGDPKLAKELDLALNQLKGMVASFPKLSPEDLASLSNLLTKFSELAKQMPQTTQKAFWQTLNEMLEKMITTNSTTAKQFQGDIKAIQTKMQEMGKLKNEVSSLLNLLTNGQIKTGLSQFIALLKGYAKLRPDNKKTLATTLAKVSKMKGKDGASLLQLLAHAQISEWIRQAGPHATKQQIIEYITKQLKEPPYNQMSPPVSAELVNAIQQQMKTSDFPSLAPMSYEVDGASTKNEVEAYFKSEGAHYENQSQGLTQAAAEAGRMGDSLGKAAAYGATEAASSGSLPNQFQNVILNHYMPAQEKYLLELAEILNFDNMGAEFGNALMSIMSNFGNASTNFDINATLHGTGTKGQYQGSATYEQGLINKAKANAYKDKDNVKKSINKITDQINAIKNNPSLTQAQKNQMRGQLTTIQNQLKIALPQVTALYNLYSHMTAKNVTGSNPPAFKISCPITTWQQQLSALESIAVSGATKSQVAECKKWGIDIQEGGGLQTISSNVNTFQQDYSDQGQNQQMVLQMRMTEIQQEWTVVATSLQLLNQMYMSLSQAIYKS